MKSQQDRQAGANLIEMQEQINIGCWGDNLLDFFQCYLSVVRSTFGVEFIPLPNMACMLLGR